MTTAHLHYLDGWRGLAITLLLIGHFFPVPGINLGTVGVNLFFVLSGLLMARLLFLREVPLPEFYKRRISRIFPAFFVFLTVVVAWHAASGRVINLTEVLSAATFTKNYFMDVPENTFMPFGHIWSLSVEEHAYILLSLLAVLARRKIVAAKWSVLACTLGMVAIGLTYRYLYEGRERGFHLAHSEFAAFGIFVSVLLVLYFHGRKLPSINFVAFGILFMTAVMMHWWSMPMVPATMGGVALLALSLHVLGGGPLLAQRILEWRPLRQLGLWSYSLYLWQQPFYRAMHQHELSAPLAIVLAFACGIASYYVVEQPARKYLNRRWAAPAVPEKAGPAIA